MKKEWNDRDSLDFIEPIGDIDRIELSDSNCCSNSDNHKKVPLLYSFVTICTQCNKKLENN